MGFLLDCWKEREIEKDLESESGKIVKSTGKGDIRGELESNRNTTLISCHTFCGRKEFLKTCLRKKLNRGSSELRDFSRVIPRFRVVTLSDRCLRSSSMKEKRVLLICLQTSYLDFFCYGCGVEFNIEFEFNVKSLYSGPSSMVMLP